MTTGAPGSDRLLVDVGNTRVKWRSVDPAGTRSAVTAMTHAEFALALRPFGAGIVAACVSNVAGLAVEARIRTLLDGVPVHLLTPTTTSHGLVNDYRDPTRLGPDRWAAMLGARSVVRDRHLLVCNFGTATTIDLVAAGVDGHARFVGGLILPGIDAMRRSLQSETARLPLADGTATDFADNTDDAITGGVLAAQLGAVERSVTNAMRELAPIVRPMTCLVTGGAAHLVTGRLAVVLGARGCEVRVVPDLVLRGLELVMSDNPRLDPSSIPD